MNETKAKHMFESAKDWAETEDLFPPWEPADFDTLDSKQFLGHYCHVVFVAGFRYAVVRKYADETARAFKGYDLKKLAETDHIDIATVPIKNEMKIDWFLAGVKSIHAEGFDAFKERVKRGGMDELKTLKGIGDVTKKHLAMIVGVEDTAKDDVWLVKCATACNGSVESLVEYLSAEFKLPKWWIDGTLWVYCEQNEQIPPTT